MAMFGRSHLPFLAGQRMSAANVGPGNRVVNFCKERESTKESKRQAVPEWLLTLRLAVALALASALTNMREPLSYQELA